MKLNIEKMIDTINKLELRKQKEDEIKEMLKRDDLNKTELRKILQDANDNNIKLSASVVKDIRNKLADNKWKPADWISADCNIKQCSDEEVNEPPIIKNEDSYQNYLFYEYVYDSMENKCIYYNKETTSYLAMDVEGNVYALKSDTSPTNLNPDLIENTHGDCIFKKINMGKGDALSVCSACSNINNIQTQQKNIKKPIKSLLKGISSINNKPKTEYSDYLIVKNNNLYNKYKNLLNKNPQVGGNTDTDLNNFINAVFKDNLDIRKYLIKFDIYDPNPITDTETYKMCKKSSATDSEIYYNSPEIFNNLTNGRIRFINNNGDEIDDSDIDYIKTIFEDYTILPNMTTIPEKFVNSNREMVKYLTNLMVLKIIDGKEDNKDFDYSEKYQIYLIANKTNNNNVFKDSIKIYRDADNEIYCPAVVNQKTGRLLEDYNDKDLLYVINIPHIFKFYSLREKDKIILEEINETDENTEEVGVKIKNILSNKITLFSNKSNNKILTQEEKETILTEEQTRRLTRQKDAWKIVGGKNFNGDISKLFTKLEIVKDITYPSDSALSTKKPLNNLDFNKTLMKIKFKYIKGDRGWKISNNSIFNKNLFNEETFDKIHEGEQIYKYPVKFNINDKVHSHIPGNKLDIEILFENIFYNKWFFEEVTYLANKPNNYKNNPILLSYLNNNNIDTKVEGEVSHSLIENNYIITSKLFETSELIYNDLTSDYISEKDLHMNIYYYKKPTEESEYIDLNKSDIINQMKKLYYSETANKADVKKMYINYINNKYLKDNINNNLVLTNNIYGSNLTDINYMFKFTKVEDVDEGYKINYLDNKIGLTNENLTYQVIKQSGNYEGYYVIKDIKNDTYMYVDNIEGLVDIKIVSFDKPRKLSNKYLFKIETKDYKKSLPNAILRKDLTDGNYNIKLYKTSSYLHTLLSKSTTDFYLDKLENIFKLNNKNLNKNLQSTYMLEDTTSVIDIVVEYIPFYSHNYSLYVIRDKNEPSNVLYVNEDNVPIWITYTIENLLNNKSVLEKCLWKFEKKIIGGSKKTSKKLSNNNNNCIIS